MSTGKLPSPPWFKYFDSLTLAKGKEYFERDKVLNFEFNNSDSLKGTVSGSSGKVYSVLIHFNKTMDGISRTSCTCPIGFDCKHTAAAVVKFLVSQNNGQKSGANNTENSNKDDHEEQELLAAPSIAISKETQTALNRLHWRHAEAKGIDFSEIEPPKGPNSRQSIVLYGLGTHVTSCRPHIAVFKTNINKDGSRGAMSEIAWEKLFGYQPASFITPEDEEIGRLWDVVSRYGTNYRSWLDSSKELFEVFIQRILKSGRCFRIGELDLMLSPGRPLTGRLEWASKDKKALWLVPVIDQGSQSTSSIAISRQAGGTPRYDASSSTAPIQANEIQVIRWTSPHYFNLFTGEFGPLKIDIDSNFMEEVLRLKINADESMMVDHILSKTGLA